MHTRHWTTRAVAALAALISLAPGLFGQGGGGEDAAAVASPLPNSSFFGMNLYITGFERSKEEALSLVNDANLIGVKWSREEFSWANLEPTVKGQFGWVNFDGWVRLLNQKGIKIVGVLETTPAWASGVKQGSVPDWYWYAPNNPQDYADFAYATAAHYAGKVDVWELWNEPDVEITFKCGCDRAKRYADMLSLAYTAIKRANPNATVLIGGLSIHDVNNNGMAFLNQVVAASGGALNFDVLSIHPYMPDRPPESTDPNTVVQNFQYRLDMSYKWLKDHGAPNKEIWITEDGYSTCTGCGTLGVSEEEQARRLVRLHVIAMAAPNVTQFDYFQMKDKFNAGAGDLWGNMAILRNNLTWKPAAYAYKVLTTQLEGATFLGQGPLMRQVANRWQTQFDRYHYRFMHNGAVTHVIWRIGGSESVTVPLSQPLAQVLDKMGKPVAATPGNNSVTLTISEDPLYIVERASADGNALDSAQDPSSPTGLRASVRFLPYWQDHGGLPLFGYAITPERVETSPTNGRPYMVQWFERARFEWHPENAGTQYEVLLGLLGSQLVKGRTFPSLPPPQGADAVCTKETGHCVWGRFLDTWRKLGVPVVGLPLSDQFEERSTDGKTYIVQYFERARFEYHPENPQPYDVLLGLLGRQMVR